MIGIHPYISFQGTCREAVEFYQSALGGQVLFLQTYGESPMAGMGEAGNIMHCSMKIGDSVVMMCDDPRQGGEVGGNISLAIGLNDPARAQVLFDNLAAGGTVLMPLGKTFWAEAFGMVTDRFGVKWMVNCDSPQPQG